ncbi:hypothetical protein [Chryseobacterium defluvii]|uniref:Uncharacterized protein n=1 Tax=Chryseobacterium defluvii TaxID=160396 RepID=A0A495SNU5_9FLAO|nr:hypothetical protein [Chryseobacterium defluvii]RKT01034.1 hypothetical protein BCF58_0245 [Chryseobacterium defluvii]
MEGTKYQKEVEELKMELFGYKVLSYEVDLVGGLEKSMNMVFQKLNKAFEFNSPIAEDEILQLGNDIQRRAVEIFSLSSQEMKVFETFKYALNPEDKTIYFQSKCILEVLSNYLLSIESKLDFDDNDPIFDLLHYLYNSNIEDDKEEALNILIEFNLKLYGFIIYRDYLKIIGFLNNDFLISPHDNHIPIRIAMLDSLNLISELNNSVPNKENIYRIIHAIVGGNEDNVKKYCLSLIGKNSLSQKQITKKHKEFAQKYINEKKI